MNIFQIIWNAISTPNETLINISGFFLCFIEAYVSMCLFTTLLDIKTNRKSKLAYVLAFSIVGFISRIVLPNPIGTIVNMTSMLILIMFIFKTNFIKGLFSIFVPIFIISALELIIFKVYLKVFNLDYENLMSIPFYRFISTLSIYLILYLFYKLIKYIKFNINLDILSKKNKILYIINAILGLCVIGTQLYLISYYSDSLPVIITLVSIIGLAGYLFLSLYSMLNVTKLEITTRDLEVQHWHNKELQDMHDNLRTFKHDFNNIIQSIGGYLDKDDMDGLRKYYSGLLADCKITVNLAALDPNVINSPAIYNILSSKYYKANENNIVMNIESFLNLKEIEDNMKIYEFVRMFGILLDNAIEACKLCEDKKHIWFKCVQESGKIILSVKNTYCEMNRKKKEGLHGIGLKNVEHVITSYGGNYSIKKIQGKFIVTILFWMEE